MQPRMDSFYNFVQGDEITVVRGYGTFCHELELADNSILMHNIPIELLVRFLEFMSLKEDLGLSLKYIAPNKEGPTSSIFDLK